MTPGGLACFPTQEPDYSIRCNSNRCKMSAVDFLSSPEGNSHWWNEECRVSGICYILKSWTWTPAGIYLLNSLGFFFFFLMNNVLFTLSVFVCLFHLTFDCICSCFCRLQSDL